MIRAAFVIVFAFAAGVLAFDYGREYERARVKPCPVVDRVATYSTDEIARMLKARRRLERVK
jgi:hypothetical protein